MIALSNLATAVDWTYAALVSAVVVVGIVLAVPMALRKRKPPVR